MTETTLQLTISEEMNQAMKAAQLRENCSRWDIIDRALKAYLKGHSDDRVQRDPKTPRLNYPANGIRVQC